MLQRRQEPVDSHDCKRRDDDLDTSTFRTSRSARSCARCGEARTVPEEASTLHGQGERRHQGPRQGVGPHRRRERPYLRVPLLWGHFPRETCRLRVARASTGSNVREGDEPATKGVPGSGQCHRAGRRQRLLRCTFANDAQHVDLWGGGLGCADSTMFNGRLVRPKRRCRPGFPMSVPAYLVTVPVVVIRSIECRFVNHNAPSGPAVIFHGNWIFGPA